MVDFKQVIAVTTVTQVIDLIGDLQSNGRIAWRVVDNNDNNLATINLGSDPAAGVIERITNAFDAVLELEFLKRDPTIQPISPRAATEEWFGIPDGKLARLNDVARDIVTDLSERVQVTLRDSERDDRPTIDVRDTGIGIKAEEFGSTILSLHKSRKLKKLYLAGAFGQGGSTALAYSSYTLILSRPSPLAGQIDQSGDLAFTVVRFDPGDVTTDKHGVYQFMVDAATGHPITIAAPDSFEAGTLVRHVAMDIGKYKATLTAPTGSLWFLAHNYLFDPVLPFKIIETRTGKTAATRISAGNFRLLSQGQNTEYKRSARLTFRSGAVTISWWVLAPEGEQARNRITQYVMPSKPIVVTYNGQKQGDFSNTVIKNELRLPYLERYIIVHVDCDKLDNEARRQLFPTTRETIRDTPIGDDLRRLIVDTLAGDPRLQELDDERKRRYLQRGDNEAIANIRRRLSNRVKAVIKTAGGGKGPGTVPPDNPSPSEPQPPIPISEPPTLLEIVGPEPRKVYAGKRFTIRFRTDADPAYFQRPDSFIAIIDPPKFGQYGGNANVHNGYGVAYFTAAEDLEIGTAARITLEVRPRRSQSLHASRAVEVVELPESAKPGEGSVSTPNINPQWISENDAFWQDNNWNRRSVAKVVQSEDSVDIFVSSSNERLVSLISRAQRRDLNAVEAVKNFYLEHISFHAFIASIQEVEPASTSDEEEEAPRGEQSSEMGRACDTVCGIIDAMFELIATGSGTDADNPEQPDQTAVVENVTGG